MFENLFFHGRIYIVTLKNKNEFLSEDLCVLLFLDSGANFIILAANK